MARPRGLRTHTGVRVFRGDPDSGVATGRDQDK